MQVIKKGLSICGKVFTIAMSMLTLLACISLPVKSEPNEINSLAIDHVWSGHRIKPYLLTRGQDQFVAYFDANRQMTIAHRRLGKVWRYYKVDSWLGWDSHNYVTLEIDDKGYIHVMGNMHADPMEYFRSTQPLSVRTLKRVPVMVDNALEQRMTYPIFMRDKNNALLVKYRDGGSGNGNEIYNIYDTDSQTWSRLHANQFLDGEGKMSGYFEGPTKGPDGYFHLIWVWRNTPNAATNHSLSYAKSLDLVKWQDSNGKPLPLPLTLAKTEVVDPVPPGAGMINGNVKLGFDQQQNPIISYHKYDENGNTQLYVARKQGQSWHSVQVSQWQNFRWDFGGAGSLGRFPIKPYAPEVIDENTIGVMVRKNDEVMRFYIDAKSLTVKKTMPASLYPQLIEAKTLASNQAITSSKSDQLEHHVFVGKGDRSADGGQYYLSWFSQPGNRDRAHETISPPSVMLLHEVK